MAPHRLPAARPARRAVPDGGGSLLASPICFSARKLDQGELVANAQLGGATPLWEWIGDDGATVFSY